MPADTATTKLGLLLQGTGNNDNTWGQLLNEQVIQYLEDTVVGTTALATTGGATSLTQAQCRCSVLAVSGLLVSNATLTVPAVSRPLTILNNTNGAFSVLVKSVAATTHEIPQGTIKRIYTDGTNVTRFDDEIIGEFFYHAGGPAPNGSLECTGAAVSRTGHPNLFAKISTLHGAGDGSTTFNLPNGTTAGMFLRSRTGTVSAGTVQAETIGPHSHTASGTASTTLSGSVDAGGGHTPALSSATWSTALSGTVDAIGNHSHGALTGNDNANHTHSGTTGDDSPDHTHDVSAATSTFSAQSGGGTLTRTSTLNGAITSAGASARHQHAFTTGGISANHQHAISADGAHAHGFGAAVATTTVTSFVMAAVANHQHGVTGVAASTTITGVTVNNNSGTENRPVNISAILCVRL